MLDRPISTPIAESSTEQAWEQVNSLFRRNGLSEPPVNLRDEIVIALSWAWYGVKLDGELSSVAGYANYMTEAWQVAKEDESASPLTFPRELTDDLRDALSTMVWQSGRIAHCLRATGTSIKTRAEDEQAHVLHWLICLALEHGSEWRAKASERIAAIRDSLSKSTS